MEKEFEIQGNIVLIEKMSIDRFHDVFIDFIESNNWFFGGGINENRVGAVFGIQGCVSVKEEVTREFFNVKLDVFLKTNSWSFEGEIDEIIDGYYINNDGSKGAHVWDNE